MYITSKTGAVIDGEKVDRETFFDTLNKWGKMIRSLSYYITAYSQRESTSMVLKQYCL